MSNSLKHINTKPIVLSISGHDPTGGAGIQADIEAIVSQGCHACSILTCLTIQDSTTVHQLIPLNANNLTEQATVLFNDVTIAAIKIGLTGSVECVSAIADLLQLHPTIPVIFDPVLACGDGTPLADHALIDAIKDELIPLTTVLTPNTLEASQLTGLAANNNSEPLGLALLNEGADYVLITGGHSSSESINNHLFHQNKLIETYRWPRLAGEYHGTGCTLASAITALIARGESVPNAIQHAQTYTNNTIQHAQTLGHGQLFPNRTRL